MTEETKCQCPSCLLGEEILGLIKDRDAEDGMNASLRATIAKMKQLDAERPEIGLENIIVSVIDMIAGKFGMIREIGVVGPDDIFDPKKGLH
jgi:hypothetical protein